jgi:hypothetical protein
VALLGSAPAQSLPRWHQCIAWNASSVSLNYQPRSQMAATCAPRAKPVCTRAQSAQRDRAAVVCDAAGHQRRCRRRLTWGWRRTAAHQRWQKAVRRRRVRSGRSSGPVRPALGRCEGWRRLSSHGCPDLCESAQKGGRKRTLHQNVGDTAANTASVLFWHSMCTVSMPMRSMPHLPAHSALAATLPYPV